MSDFTGFYYNGIHSSSKNIIRISNGSRYEDDIIPTMQDKTVQIPGGDGTYYFGSYYTQRTFNLKIAYDSVSESNIREIRNWLGDREIHPLIFDEQPYKVYYAKCSNSPKFQYICFNNSNNARVYKGEADITFTCFDPFAHCLDSKKYLNLFSDSNKSEWQVASGLLASKGNYDGVGLSINLYNPGDLETNFYAYYSNIALTKIAIGTKELNLNISSFKTGDNKIRINTYNHMIEGMNGDNLTGNIYNDCIVSGDFFKIPKGSSTFISTSAACTKIEYDYLYL